MQVLRLGVLRTEKAKGARVIDDNLRRVMIIAKALRPLLRNAEAVCAEAMSFPRSASSAGKTAMVWGVLAAGCVRRPLLHMRPQDIKQGLTGRSYATKGEVEAVLVRRYGPKVRRLLRDVPASLHEHAFDALAAVTVIHESLQRESAP